MIIRGRPDFTLSIFMAIMYLISCVQEEVADCV